MTIYCVFEPLGEQTYRCTACARIVRSRTPRISAQCRAAGDSVAGITLFQKAHNFAASAVKHVAAGMPQSSEEEVARRFAICETCKHFDGKACRECGCPVVREKKFLSKLSWGNEKCPVGKW